MIIKFMIKKQCEFIFNVNYKCIHVYTINTRCTCINGGHHAIEEVDCSY